jgi:hypothetical protein
VFFGIQDDVKSPEKFCEFCTEFRTRYLNRISPSTSPTVGKRKILLISPSTPMEVFLLKQERKGEITWYRELWDNGKRVMIRMPWWGHEGGEDTGSNMATSGHSEQSKR